MSNIWLDGMMGLVVGDALGCPVQFNHRGEMVQRPPVTGMEGWGKYNMPPGSWTDDSSMALASLDSIINKGCVDHEDTMKNFVRWAFLGDYTPFGLPFDEGDTCLGAIFRYKDTKDWKTCGKTGERANGNGALMRILPVCLYYIQKRSLICTSSDEAIEAVHQSSALTHNHIRSQMACGLYYFMAKAIVDKAGDNLKACLQSGLDEGFSYYGRDLRNPTTKMYYSRMFDLDEMAKIPREEIRSSGYVVDSIEAAVWCLVTTDSLKECLLKAVNLGGDTDTIAAIAGGLAGLFYGYESIPKEWLEEIQRREYIEELCEKVNRQ